MRQRYVQGLMLLAALSILVAAASAPAHQGAARDRDEAEIRSVQTRQAEAWNRHDAKAYADLFTEDGDVVNVVGWWWKGRAEIQAKLTAAFAFVFRESTMTITEVQVRFLSPDTCTAKVLAEEARTPRSGAITLSSRWRGHAQVAELALGTTQTPADLPQRVRAPQLAE